MRAIVHIINHTHWDREWFLTSIYTSQWIPGLIDKLEQLKTNNSDYKFLIDGQTLVIEDLLQLDPSYQDKINSLVQNGHLIIGPYYCQPDWRITGGETLIRNLLYGRQDMLRYGGHNHVGWMVDTFGHISQAPQLHKLFGLDAVFVWRGVPKLEPYFYWQGADGHQLFTIDLFGGYRNLYGITHVPEVAIRRLKAEVAKLQPFYPTADIPLFDGYDLEQNPEDPILFYQQHATAIPQNIQIKESSPGEFAHELSGKLQDLPVIIGELNSGKYGATFPGTLSTRTYLKIMNWDCERLLYKMCEPLAVLARFKGRAFDSQQYETWGRTLLQNTIHDCICGVSIDQVHEKMEHSYRELYEGIKKDVYTSLAYVLQDFAPGMYAVSTNPFAYEGWQVVRDQICHLATNGIGAWQITQTAAVERPNKPTKSFKWQNDHYSATVAADGAVQIDAATLGYLVIDKDKGDTYSDEARGHRSRCESSGPLIVEEKSAHHCVVRFDCSLQLDGADVSATVRLIFDQTPLLRWQVDLDSRGTNFRVDMAFETAHTGEIYAGMPFDVVSHPVVDQDLLPRQLESGLAKVLMGQRELGEVKVFPFHDFVAISDDLSSAVIMAKGLHSYQAEDDGTIYLSLRRSVEWLTASGLQHRAGDAGPFMYVPDARCERTVRHEIAVMFSSTSIDDLTIHKLNAGFQNPPLVVAAHGKGERTQWQFLQENLPLSSLSFYNDKPLARFYNPTNKSYPFSFPYRKTSVWGSLEDIQESVPAKEIMTVVIEKDLPEIDAAPFAEVVTPLIFPAWRVGKNKGRPDPEVLQAIEAKITRHKMQLSQITEQLKGAKEDNLLSLQHRYYVLKRELYELRFSLLLNQRKLAMQGKLDYEYLYALNPEVAELGKQLNELRIKRRIYDYVVKAII